MRNFDYINTLDLTDLHRFLRQLRNKGTIKLISDAPSRAFFAL